MDIKSFSLAFDFKFEITDLIWSHPDELHCVIEE